MVMADIAWLGHSRLIVKVDDEAALQALVKQSFEILRVKCEAVESAFQEQPPTYDSQANGGTEVGVHLIRGFFRTLKLCAEARLDKLIPIGHAIIPLLRA